MAGFLRKKSKVNPKQTKLNEEPKAPPRTSGNDPLVPPLYAKFTTASSSSMNTDARASNVSRPMVSGPMSLAGAKKGGPGSPGGEAGAGAGPGSRGIPMNGRNGAGAYLNPNAPGNGYFPADPHSQVLPYTSASGTHFQPVGSSGPNPAASRRQVRQDAFDSPITSRASLERPVNGSEGTLTVPTRFAGNSSLSHSSTSVDKPLPVPSLIPVAAVPSAASNADSRDSYVDQQLQDDLRLLYNTNIDSAYPDIRHKADTNPKTNGNVSTNAHTPSPNPPNPTHTRPHLTQPANPRYSKDILASKQLPPQPPSDPPTSTATPTPTPPPSKVPPQPQPPLSLQQPPRTEPRSQYQPPSPTKQPVSVPPAVKKSSFFGISRLSISRGSSSRQSVSPSRNQSQSQQPPTAFSSRAPMRAGRASLDSAVPPKAVDSLQRGRSVQVCGRFWFFFDFWFLILISLRHNFRSCDISPFSSCPSSTQY